MNLVEFVLCVPVVAALFLAPIQVQRLWLRQFALEREAFRIARALGAEPGDAAQLGAFAATLAGPDTSCEVRLRDLQPPLSAPPRLPRKWNVIEVDLARPSGVSFPPAASPVLRAHARELRLRGES